MPREYNKRKGRPRGKCKYCKVQVRSTGKYPDGETRYGNVCQGCHDKKYRKYKKTYCEDCGPEIKYYDFQLDAHHLDNNHSNNTPLNIKTLCSNCHRLYTHGIKGKR